MKCVFNALLLATLVDRFFFGSCKNGSISRVIFLYYLMRTFHWSLE